MSNHEAPHSEYFEELCALAASGQISEPEFAELQDHLQQCAECRSVYADFAVLLHYKLPLVHPELIRTPKPAPMFSQQSSYRDRFLAQARKQGLPISSEPLRDGRKRRLWLLIPAYAQLAVLATILLLVTVGILGYNLRQSNSRYLALTADLAAMREQIRLEANPAGPAPLEESQAESPSAVDAGPPPLATAPSAEAPELVRVRQDLAVAELHANELLEQLQTAANELEVSGAQLQEASDARNQLENKLAQAEQMIARVDGELQSLRGRRSQDAATIAAQDLEMQQLSEQLTAQRESLERETALLAASRDIHDLMGARNLHIVDVLDVDSKGKDKRAFGRVFYTEEKSLIFYAFDLGDRTTARRNASFQVWGARGPAQNPAQSLGIFYVDDQKQNRWVLKFDDPRILAQIDSVFVTIEPSGGSPRPTGNKLLYAYLKANANHP